MPQGSIQNWSESISFTPGSHVHLRSEDDVVNAVQRAREHGTTIRPIGSVHSSTPVYETPDTVVSVDEMSGLSDHDPARRQVTLGPGTSLSTIGEQAAEVGLAMENLGDVDYQTIAGAIGTGTHGTGVRFGNLSSTLVGGRLVTGAGDVVPFGVDAAQNSTDLDPTELLHAAQVSLGTLGIMTSMTLQLQDYYELHRHNWMTHVDWTMGNFDQLVADNRHMDFYWYPRSEEAQVRTLNEPGQVPALTPPGRLKKEQQGPSHEIIPNVRDLKFDEMEYMFPLEQGMEIFEQIRRRVRDRHRHHIGWRVLVRTVKADNAMLSNCQGQDTMTIALLHNNVLPYQEYFDDMEPLMLDLGGRPHWGKKHTRKAADLAPMYPQWNTFQDYRRRLDPSAVFMNDYLTDLFEEPA